MDILPTLTTIISILGGATALSIAITKYKKVAVKVSGHFLLAVGTLVILGYALDAPSIYTIPLGATPVALPTAMCLLVIGGNLLMLSNGPLK